MGLLDRAKGTENFPPLDADYIQSQLDRETGLLERVPLFFTGLMDFWKLSKGVFLSRKGKNYVPVEVKGFDTTTARRMRVSQSLLEKWNVGAGGKIVDDSILFENLFSLRELSQITRLLIIPLYYKTKSPFGLLLLAPGEDDGRFFSNSSTPFCTNNEIMGLLEKSLHPFSESNNTVLQPMSKEEIKKEILTNGDDFLIMLISLSPLLSKIKEWHNLRDPFELKQELISLFSSFFNERVTLYLQSDNRLFISYPQELFPGKNLMIRQIMNSLNELYGSKMTEDALSIKIMHLSSQENGKDFLTEV